MSFSKRNEDPKTAILRVLQQEFSTKLAIERKLVDLLPSNPSPCVYLDILDVEVAAYEIFLPEKLADLKFCSSYKLTNHRFDSVDAFLKSDIPVRSGVIEILTGSGKCGSNLNRQLIKVAPNLKFAYDFEKYMQE